MINRRELMTGAAVTAFGAAALKWNFADALAQGNLPPIDIAKPIVDIHCHIFNASDLPVYGFVKQAVFEVWDTQTPAEEAAAEACHSKGKTFFLSRWGLKGLAATLEYKMSGSMKALDEALKLQNPLVSAGPTVNQITSKDALDEFLAPESPLTPAGPADPGKARLRKRRKEDFTPEGLKQAQEELRQLDLGNPNARPQTGPLVSASIAQSWVAAREFVNRHLDWADHMKWTRLALAQTVTKIYTSPNARVRLFTPALIDYSKWLDDKPESSLATQVDAMEQVAVRTVRQAVQDQVAGARFHGYIAFDPLRDVHENGAALALAQKAVREKGFLGVKMYPPMGFKPLGNDVTMPYPKQALEIKDDNGHVLQKLSAGQLSDGLNRRLSGLYAWAAAEGVPILSHAANSNGSGPCYGQRASIQNWFAVVDGSQFKNIRLCLAHLGSFDAARDAKGVLNGGNTQGLQQSWEWAFGRLIQTSNAKNVYADLSYFSELLKGNEADMAQLKKAFVALFKVYAGMNGQAALVDHLIYGSDWIMLDREANKEQHMRAVYWFLDGVLKEAYPGADTKSMLVKIFSTNAIKFLGLQPGEPPFARLIAFYKKWNLPNAERLLDEFKI